MLLDVVTDDLPGVSAARFKELCRRLEREPTFGKPLSRELAGLRKARLGGSENRLVYRYDEVSDHVLVIAVGRRRDSEIYDRVGNRA
ncbi:MAG: type II toxin-antitoxin system RelE/ParE family toxin [Actinomycetota bacterium]|nr:type II toxin-antitoxin system RelE/ParE family toxin [Actinomycetota bacterium]